MAQHLNLSKKNLSSKTFHTKLARLLGDLYEIGNLMKEIRRSFPVSVVSVLDSVVSVSVLYRARRERFYVDNREREMSIGTGGHNLYIRFTSRTNNRFRKKF